MRVLLTPGSDGGQQLFRHDWRIASNALRGAFAGWHDRVIATAILLVAVAVIRATLSEYPWNVAVKIALGAGIVAGLFAGRLIAYRLAFHCSDGLLAADALHLSARRRYSVAWHGIGIATLAVVTLIARPSLLVISVPTYLLGALVARFASGFELPGTAFGKVRPGWALRRQLYRPIAGIVSAMLLLLSLLPARGIAPNALMVLVGTEAVLLTLPLTALNHHTVQFLTIVGHGSWQIIARYAQGMLLFVGITVPACWVASGPMAAGIVAVVSLAMLLVFAMRVFAYRLHGKRLGDLVVSALSGLLLYTSYNMPIVLPFLIIAILWHWHRRAVGASWQLS